MSDKLEKFVAEHRQEFDANTPDKELWNKIDAQLNAKTGSSISSKLFLKLKYLGFSASMLIIGIYFVYTGLSLLPQSSASTEMKPNYWKQPAFVPSGHPQLNVPAPKLSRQMNHFSGNTDTFSAVQSKQELPSEGKERMTKKDNLVLSPDKENIRSEPSVLPSQHGMEGPEAVAPSREKDGKTEKKRRNAELYIPGEPEKMNSYTATLYDASSLCDVLQVFKFPGKASIDVGKWKSHNQKKIFVQTVSCAHLGNTGNVNAVWIKGRTDKEILITMKRKLRNIVLVKPDGSKLYPEAISHYYPGRGAITSYSGKYFNLVFKRQVELILFFENAEEGDKILISGSIEAVVKNQP